MAIKRRIGCAIIEVTGLNRRDPRILAQAGNVADHVRPILGAVPRDLQIAVVGSHPNQLAVFRRFANRIDRSVHFRRGVVDGDAA